LVSTRVFSRYTNSLRQHKNFGSLSMTGGRSDREKPRLRNRRPHPTFFAFTEKLGRKLMQGKMPAHQRNEDNFDTRAVCWGSYGRGTAPTSCITNLL